MRKAFTLFLLYAMILSFSGMVSAEETPSFVTLLQRLTQANIDMMNRDRSGDTPLYKIDDTRFVSEEDVAALVEVLAVRNAVQQSRNGGASLLQALLFAEAEQTARDFLVQELLLTVKAEELGITDIQSDAIYYIQQGWLEPEPPTPDASDTDTLVRQGLVRAQLWRSSLMSAEDTALPYQRSVPRINAVVAQLYTQLEAEPHPAQLLKMNTEAGIREYLAGEWRFYDTACLGYDSCRMVIDEDLNVEFEFYSGLTNKFKGDYCGQFSFDRIFADAHEAPDLLCLELSGGGMLQGGEFFFLHRTVFEGRRVMSLFSAGNGGCVFDLLDPSEEDGWGVCPIEIQFTKEAGEEYHLAPRLNAEFFAVCWGYSDAEEGIWLDDIHWPLPGPYDPEQIGSDTWYRYLTAKYDNEMPVSVLYALADDRALMSDGDLCHGQVYRVKTNEHGKIVDMRLEE